MDVKTLRALSSVRAALKVKKSQRNSFGGYNYRSLEDITSAVNPICAENECGYFLSDSIEQVGERVYVKATATFYAHEGCEPFSVTACAREELSKKGMDAAQVTGAASSYARKYALCGLFGIDSGEDPDQTDNRAQKKRPQSKNTPQTTAKTVDPVDSAKHALWSAVKNYATVTGLDAKAMYTDAMAQCPNDGAAEWLQAKAEEFAQAASA